MLVQTPSYLTREAITSCHGLVLWPCALASRYGHEDAKRCSAQSNACQAETAQHSLARSCMPSVEEKRFSLAKMSVNDYALLQP